MKRTKSTKPSLYFLRRSRPSSGISVDASCIAKPYVKAQDGYFHGRVEWRGVDIETGEILFTSHIQEQSTVNCGEYLAIVDALNWLHCKGDTTTPVYSDSVIAIDWIRTGPRTKLPFNEHTRPTLNEMVEAQEWLEAHRPPNPVLKWRTDLYGECAADFGRK